MSSYLYVEKQHSRQYHKMSVLIMLVTFKCTVCCCDYVSWFYDLSSVFHIITSWNALGVKEFHGLSIVPVTRYQKRRMNYRRLNYSVSFSILVQAHLLTFFLPPLLPSSWGTGLWVPSSPVMKVGQIRPNCDTTKSD